MSKYPYFGKKGRPSKDEADLCKKINKLVNSGEVSEGEINQLINSDGMPTNLDELQDMYSYFKNPSFSINSELKSLGVDIKKPIIGLLPNIIWDAQIIYKNNLYFVTVNNQNTSSDTLKPYYYYLCL